MSDTNPSTSPQPIRVQLSRKKGWRMPANTVKVDRTTKWGNPFIPGERSPYGSRIADKRHAYLLFMSFAPLNEELVAMARAELRGKNLACWCAQPDPYEDACHAAVLLKIANSDGDPSVTVIPTLRRKASALPSASPSPEEVPNGE